MATSKSTIRPTKLKKALKKYWSIYSPWEQQDCQEFLNFLLDTVHEDVNKIINKPYIEVPDFPPEELDEVVAKAWWDAYSKRNDSIVVDLFQGQYKSKITCKDCGHVSVCF